MLNIIYWLMGSLTNIIFTLIILCIKFVFSIVLYLILSFCIDILNLDSDSAKSLSKKSLT
ncbi:hypothetical protein [Helicobacter sp. MIT 14-3879]|uniref:hypothetical protein n=1 Tax=Helicobacter sp. MIT 14-3879 TaxID=2040649 RepID=UPI001C6A639A